MDVQRAILAEMQQAVRFLDVISNELDSINKHVAKYLDRVEKGMTDSIKTDIPGVSPKVVTCSKCGLEIKPGELYAWSNATLPVCYPCASPSEVSNACAAEIFQQPLELKIDDPPVMSCTACFTVINYRKDWVAQRCKHGQFCVACGLCDECVPAIHAEDRA